VESNVDKWNAWYAGAEVQKPYGDVTTYARGAAFLEGLSVEDWGCGLGWFKFHHKGPCVGLDGSNSPFADKKVDLVTYRSETEGLFMRHVLEHDHEWKALLENALASFKKRMVLVVFTPFGPETRVIGTTKIEASLIPDISFRRNDLLGYFGHLLVKEESCKTATQYEREHVFYLQRP
jgi:hypothetical protein